MHQQLPFNSGGPLSDEHGRIVGVIVAQLRPYVAQNVNYVIKRSIALAFLRKTKDVAGNIRTISYAADLSFEDAVENVQKATVLIVAY